MTSLNLAKGGGAMEVSMTNIPYYGFDEEEFQRILPSSPSTIGLSRRVSRGSSAALLKDHDHLSSIESLDSLDDDLKGTIYFRKRRRVQFNESQNVSILPPDELSTAEGSSTSESWYSPKELRDMKHQAKRSCVRDDLEYSLNDAYLLSTAPSVDSEPAQTLLRTPFFGEQRGLERLCSRRQALARGLTVLSVKTEVFCAPSAVWDDDNSQSLAAICAKASEPATQFAHLMGKLDEIIASEL